MRTVPESQWLCSSCDLFFQEQCHASFCVILLLASGPENGIGKNLREGFVVEMLRTVAHENVDVPGLYGTLVQITGWSPILRSVAGV